MHVDEPPFSNFAIDLRVSGLMSKDLVWSRYRHRLGMFIASVMWLPRTQQLLTMHSQRATCQWNCRAASAYNLQPRNISQSQSEFPSALETQLLDVALLTAIIGDLSNIRLLCSQTDGASRGPQAAGCSDSLPMDLDPLLHRLHGCGT
jgi:hypothetical protein